MWKTANEYRRFFKRLFAQHETPPRAVCGRPHIAVLKSDQLPLAGGGSSSLPDFSHTCRPITREYVEDAISWETVEDLVESVGLDLDELAALPTEEFFDVARKKPLELIALLQIHGLAHLTFLVFPADVTITVLGRAFGVDPAPFLALDPDEGSAAFRERIYGSAAFIEDMPAENGPAVLLEALYSGDFPDAVRWFTGGNAPFLQ